MKYKNLYLIGTSHISKDSVKEVEKTILKVRPRFVAIELDRRRLSLLENKKKSRISFKDIRNLGLKGFLLNLIGAWFEKKMGKKVGVEPGSEMKMAINLSKKLNINLVLIDQDIKFTINQLLSRITRKEKFRFIKDLFFGNETNFDIKKVPSQRVIKKCKTVDEAAILSLKAGCDILMLGGRLLVGEKLEVPVSLVVLSLGEVLVLGCLASAC